VSQADFVVRVSCSRATKGWECAVSVKSAGSETTHAISVSETELARYSATSSDVENLVERSFRFLLQREPKESILRRFALSDIERYFPEFESHIRHS
jgi:hypothetical protein